MNAIELTLPPGEKPTGVWMCGACHRLEDHNGAPALIPDPKMPWCSDPAVLAKHSAWARERAERCCTPTLCRTCRKSTGKDYWLVCDACRVAEEAAKELARFEKAAKVAYDGGMVMTPGDRFFDSLETFEDHYAHPTESPNRPEYVWLCKPVKWKPDLAEHVLHGVHDNMHEDAGEQLDPDALKELDAFGKDWWEKHGVKSFEPDYTRCVLLPAKSEHGATGR